MTRITEVEPLLDYTLRIRFADGSVRDVDLEPELWGPMFEPLRDPEEFRKVTVDSELGTIVWPNGADLDPDVLHGDEPAADVQPPAAA
jgi:Protein of unknown function (DUF2442)